MAIRYRPDIGWRAGCRADGGEKENGVFECAWKNFPQPSLMDLAKWKTSEKDESGVPDVEELASVLPVLPVNNGDLNNPPADKVQVTWIGHATVLVQFDGINILSDPIFSDFAGLTQGIGASVAGYKRYTKPACAVKELPRIDVVIISHDHYDHLDRTSVKEINKWYPDVKWFCGMGIKQWLCGHTGCKRENITELSWWQEIIVPSFVTRENEIHEWLSDPGWKEKKVQEDEHLGTNRYNHPQTQLQGQREWLSDPGWKEKKVQEDEHLGTNRDNHPQTQLQGQRDQQSDLQTPSFRRSNFQFVCVPAQHYCGRKLVDTNTRLWCGWVVKGPTQSYYFAGDTGYHETLFKKIGEIHGPFSLSAIPIGAYKPRYIKKYQHVTPQEAVDVHIDVRSEQSIGIHWGTFIMANEWYLEPPNALHNKMEELRATKGDGVKPFVSLNLGETWKVGDHRELPKFIGVQQPK